jgi:hypothetical protein
MALMLTLSPALLDQLTHAARGSVAHNIDPAIAGVAPAPVPMMGGNVAAAAVDADGDKKGAKRELSTSKRAAQNRAAQVRLQSLFLFSFPSL